MGHSHCPPVHPAHPPGQRCRQPSLLSPWQGRRGSLHRQKCRGARPERRDAREASHAPAFCLAGKGQSGVCPRDLPSCRRPRALLTARLLEGGLHPQLLCRQLVNALLQGLDLLYRSGGAADGRPWVCSNVAAPGPSPYHHSPMAATACAFLNSSTAPAGFACPQKALKAHLPAKLPGPNTPPCRKPTSQVLLARSRCGRLLLRLEGGLRGLCLRGSQLLLQLLDLWQTRLRRARAGHRGPCQAACSKYLTGQRVARARAAFGLVC